MIHKTSENVQKMARNVTPPRVTGSKTNSFHSTSSATQTDRTKSQLEESSTSHGKESKIKSLNYMKKAIEGTAVSWSKGLNKTRKHEKDQILRDSHIDDNNSVRNDVSTKTNNHLKESSLVHTAKRSIEQNIRKTKGRINSLFSRFHLKSKQVDSDTTEAGQSDTATLHETPAPTMENVVEIVMTPTRSFLLHDVTISLTVLLFFALIPTWYNWNSIVKNQLPASVIIVWLLVVFFAGVEIGRMKGMRSIAGVKMIKKKNQSLSQSGQGSVSTNLMDESVPVSCTLPAQLEMSAETQGSSNDTAAVLEGYVLFYTYAKQLIPTIRISFPEELTKQVEQTVAKIPSKFWSTLTHSVREPWEIAGYVMVHDRLMQRMLKETDFSRKPLRELIDAKLDESKPSTKADQDATGKIGSFDISELAASNLEAIVVEPCMTLRGMDIFLTDDPEDDLSSHPFLIEQGLRSTPTLFVNIIVQWANILIYFKMPDWFTDFNNIVETDDDSCDTRAIKRMLLNDDDYRNNRLKIFPCLVDGPLPIKILAPPKKELTVQGKSLPLRWIKHPEIIRADGTVLKACLELEVDVVSNSAMRSVSGILRNYIKSIDLDLAIIVNKPNPTDPDEPSACIGLFRFHYVDIDGCPRLPSRASYSSDLEADIFRASTAVNLSADELAKITEEFCSESKKSR